MTLPLPDVPGAGSTSTGSTGTGVGLDGRSLVRVAVGSAGRGVAVGDGSGVAVRVGTTVALGVEVGDGVGVRVMVAVGDGRSVGVSVPVGLAPTAGDVMVVPGVSERLARAIASTEAVGVCSDGVCASDDGGVPVSVATAVSGSAATVGKAAAPVGSGVRGTQAAPVRPRVMPEVKGTANPTRPAAASATIATSTFFDERKRIRMR